MLLLLCDLFEIKNTYINKNKNTRQEKLSISRSIFKCIMNYALIKDNVFNVLFVCYRSILKSAFSKRQMEKKKKKRKTLGFRLTFLSAT